MSIEMAFALGYACGISFTLACVFIAMKISD